MKPVPVCRAGCSEASKVAVFIKLTLSKPGGKTKDFKNVYARLIDLKGEEVLFTLHYTTRDEVKNHPIAEAQTMVGLWLEATSSMGPVYLEEDVSIQFSKKRKARLFSRVPASGNNNPPKPAQPSRNNIS